MLVAEGDPELESDQRRLIEEFERQLAEGRWAAVPLRGPDGTRQAQMVRSFHEIPADAERVIFFPRAAGGR